ncbi:hypothetical protein NSPZN2_40364 [Nitrospira defluvii]|uniref:Transposase n=1 Tax=Nitrospira defluvii TaxID=330214 RepID=A0ABN7LZI0_9BACT|nr:hypothetical protein NSPZN2_40364 [Nitrospira defluvii]
MSVKGEPILASCLYCVKNVWRATGLLQAIPFIDSLHAIC